MILLLVFLYVARQHNFFYFPNNQHSSLTFTMEEENDNMLPFFDVLVEKSSSSFIISIYKKPTFTGLYIRRDSFVLKSTKINLLIKCLTHRALVICSNCRIDAEILKVTDIFQRNRYPANVIFSSILKLNTIKSFDPSKCSVFVKLP